MTLNRMLNKAFEQYQPTHILIAFDKGPKTLRHDKLETYKGGRQKTPDELIQQFPIIKEMIKKMGIKYYEIDKIEADDIIATFAHKHDKTLEVIVMSSDKDLFQLVRENVSIAVPQNGSKPNDFIISSEFYDRFGYTPDQVKDVKGLVGDPSDNLPGVKGIGEKGAVKLLQEYKNLEGIYEEIDNIKGTIKEKLIKDKDMAFLCKDIATLMFDVDIPFSLENIKYDENVSSEFIDFLEKYELNSLIKFYGSRLKQEKTPKKNEKMLEQLPFDNLLY